ncbi:hypothetical protein [Streptomyces flavalbus]|uniref:Uncharacterized protein n=1 Tax=Streptomyces flavalbus TaxID=2665155 RepID=A0ABW2WCD2_9ACTN
MPAPRPAPHATPDSTSGVIGWAAFACVLVPVVLLVYGTSLAGAAGTALGLAAVTAVCRLLLRRSERCAARQPAEAPPPGPRGRHHRSGAGADRAGTGANRGGTGARRGGRHAGGKTPVG